MDNLKKNSFLNEWFFPAILLLLLSILTYLPFINHMGVYKEDWYILWSGRTQGGLSLIPLFRSDRPFEGYVFFFVFSLLGSQPVRWHIFIWLIRLLNTFSFLLLIRKIWPEAKQETIVASILFLVFPGFLQQPQAVSFQIHLIAFTIGILSLYLTALSFTTIKPWIRVFYFTGAFLTLLIYPVILEYCIGIEGIRIALIYMLVSQKIKIEWQPRIKKVFLAWSPYLIPIAAYFYWRLFIFSGNRPATNIHGLLNLVSQNPFRYLTHQGIEFIKDTFETIGLSWFFPISNLLNWPTYTTTIVIWLTALLAGGILLLYFQLWIHFFPRSQPESFRSSFYRESFWFGLFSVLVSLLPIALSNRDVKFVDRWDRYTIPAMLGVALLLSGIIASFLQRKKRTIILFFLLTIAVATHNYNASYMSDVWKEQKDLWWQVSWRIPALKEDSLLMVHLGDGFAFIEGDEAWAPASLIYFPKSKSLDIGGEVLDELSLDHLIHGTEDSRLLRGIQVNFNFERSLIISKPSQQSCVNVIDGRRYEFPPIEDSLVRLAAPYSQIDQIDLTKESAVPPVEIFGPEPVHGWCYFYEKAVLARQRADWETIAKLGDEAQKNGLGPNDRQEWMPFFESYANGGRVKDAKRLASVIKSEPVSRNQICTLMKNDPTNDPGYNKELIYNLLCE